jgi:hypothetical protein
MNDRSGGLKAGSDDMHFIPEKKSIFWSKSKSYADYHGEINADLFKK